MSISLNNKIENVQLEASRIVTGGTRLASLNNLYMETDWEKLKDRREKHKLVQFYKMTKKIDATLHKLLSTASICICSSRRPYTNITVLQFLHSIFRSTVELTTRKY